MKREMRSAEPDCRTRRETGETGELVEWDEWSCMCDDECPVCGRDFSPYDSEDLSDDDDEGEGEGEGADPRSDQCPSQLNARENNSQDSLDS